MELKYRRNTAEDAGIIRALINECFGYTKISGARVPVGAYLLAFDGDQLVAMSAVLESPNTDYVGGEIGWTCCKEQYRKLGIITQLINMEITRVGNDKDIYCECWATDNVPHLKHAMQQNGFVLVQEIRRRNQDRYRSCSECLFKDMSGSCRCSVVLYKRNRQVLGGFDYVG